MKSQVKAFGHVIHPMLIVFPLGLLATAVVFDILHLATGRTGFAIAAGYTIAAGLIGGVAAGLFGWLDWSAIPAGTRARRIGLFHGVGNVVVLLLFAVSWLIRVRAESWEPSVAALILSFAAVALAVVTGWLGGELVERLGIGVDKGANPDAPSSLTRRTVPGAPSSVRHRPV